MEFERRIKIEVFCIDYGFFSAGNSYAHERAISAYANRLASNKEIASMIWVNSITELTILDITEMLDILE